MIDDDDGGVILGVDLPAGGVGDDVQPDFDPGKSTNTPAKSSDVYDATGHSYCKKVCRKRFSCNENLMRHINIQTGNPTFAMRVTSLIKLLHIFEDTQNTSLEGCL